MVGAPADGSRRRTPRRVLAASGGSTRHGDADASAPSTVFEETRTRVGVETRQLARPADQDAARAPPSIAGAIARAPVAVSGARRSSGRSSIAWLLEAGVTGVARHRRDRFGAGDARRAGVRGATPAGTVWLAVRGYQRRHDRRRRRRSGREPTRVTRATCCCARTRCWTTASSTAASSVGASRLPAREVQHWLQPKRLRLLRVAPGGVRRRRPRVARPADDRIRGCNATPAPGSGSRSWDSVCCAPTSRSGLRDGGTAFSIGWQR